MTFHILTLKLKTEIAIPFLMFFLFHCTLNSYAQYTLSIKQNNEGAKLESKFFNEIKYQTNFNDSLSRSKEVNKFLAQLYEAGFLAASVDSMVALDKSLTAFIYMGKQYEWARLTKGNVNEEFLNASGFSEKNFNGKTFSIKRFAQLQQKILTECENNGYPFAGIRLDSVEIKEEGISATLNLTKGDLVKIDSVLIKGTAKIKPVYLFNYLSIKRGDVYREKNIKSISTRLKELPMVSELKPFGIEFYESKARVILYIENKRASQIDGIIGVLPDAGNEGKVVVTGDARLRLFSSFGRGELIDFNWKQPAPKTQDLKIKFNYPFLFSSPFALDAGINIYKKDSTFTDVMQTIGFQYLLPGNNYFKVFISNKNSSLIANNTLQFISLLPPYADVKTFTYGAGFKFEKVDYRLNPRKGFSGELTGGVGTKKIKQNNKIKPELYNGLDLNTTQYSSEYTLDFYFPVGKRMVLNAGSKGAYFFAPEIFTNELFRFGGLKTLRGFDEESVFATEFYMGKLEYRYILEQNSYLFTFFNAAYYANQSRATRIYDTPIGFGAGVTFETKLGIFSLNYALGKAFDNPIVFRSAKVHFGILNYF
jgi:outer membrane protein assembly factor BamA